MAMTRTPQEYQQLLGSSLEEYAKLARMIDSLLFLARAERPETHIACTLFDAREELEALQDFYDAMAEEHEVEIICQGHALVYADRSQKMTHLSSSCHVPVVTSAIYLRG